MLMVINPFNYMFSDTKFNVRKLLESDVFYVLDTDDLLVEEIAYTDLHNIITQYKVSICNIDYSAGGLYTRAGGIEFVNLHDKMLPLLGGRIEYRFRAEFVFNDVSVKFNITHYAVSVTSACYRLHMNSSILCSWEDGQTTSSVIDNIYAFRLGNYIVIRLSVLLTGITWKKRCVLTPVLDMNGGLVAFVSSNDVNISDIGMSDAKFGAKLKMLVGEKY